MTTQLSIRRYRLSFPAGVEACAFLSTVLPGDITVEVKLPPRFARIVLILHEARRADTAAGLPPGERGWRSRVDIVKKIREFTGTTIEQGSLNRYVSAMLRDVEGKIHAQSPNEIRFSLIDREFMVGMRLTRDVELDVVGVGA